MKTGDHEDFVTTIEKKCQILKWDGVRRSIYENDTDKGAKTIFLKKAIPNITGLFSFQVFLI